MKNNYILISGNKYVKNNIEDILLFINNISVGKTFPKIINFRLIKYAVFILIKLTLKILFKINIQNKIFNITELADDFIFMVKGKGNWTNIIKLVNNNGNKEIIKEVYSDNIFKKEKSFYFKYKNNKSNIFLPKTIFEGTKIKMNFISGGSLMNNINFGRISYKKSIEIYDIIYNNIFVFYSDRGNVLIHGDMGTANIYINDNNIYLIDYSDNFVGSPNYDLYVLLKSILADFGKINRHDYIINTKYEKLFLRKIRINKENLKLLENKYFTELNKKHGK